MMKRWSCVVTVLWLTACSGNSPTQSGSCGGEPCAASQRCDAATLRCVTNEVPTLSLVAPTTVVSDAQFEVTGMVEDDAAVTALEWRQGTEAWAAVAPALDGSFRFTVAAPEVDAQPVEITVRAQDGQTQIERSVTVVVDRVGPVFELKAPSLQAVIGGSAVAVAVVAHDASNGLVELTIAGQSISAPRTETQSGAEVAIPPGDRRGFDVVVSGKDLNGNRTTQTFTLQVDSTGPTLRFASPTSQTATINTPTYRVAVEATDPSAVQHVRISMADGGFVDATAQDGLWVADLAIPEVEQEVTFSAEALDAVGNLSSARSVAVQVDRVAPIVVVAGPDESSIVNSEFYVRVLASPDTVSATATFAGSTIPLQYFQNDMAWEGTMPLSVARDYSEEHVLAVARDAAGNIGTSAPYRLFIDTVAPTITFTAPAANAKLNRSNFTGSDDVTVSWQVHDADPQAATVSANGMPTTANEVRVTTSTTDDGRSITTTVTAADRRMNTATSSVTFTVDRVAPTVVSWLPAANARNVEPRTTTITFSEHVTGPTTASDALTIGGVAQPGTWNAAHTTWTSVDLTPYTVFTATLANLIDDAGNPVDAASRKFHTSAFVPPSGTVLATNVTSFDVTSDSDGVATVAMNGPGGYRVFGLSPTTGAPLAPSISDPNTGTFSLNSSLTLDPATLVATHRVGSARYGMTGTGPLRVAGLTRHGITNGVAAPIGSTADGIGAVLSQGAYTGEAGVGPFATIDGSTYQRGATSSALPLPPILLVAQSDTTWTAFSPANGLTWNRYLCIPNRLSGVPNCVAFGFAAGIVSATDIRAAIAPNGRCQMVTATNGNRYGVIQPLSNCNEFLLPGAPAHPSCRNYPALTPISLNPGLRPAPFSGNGESTLLIASEVNGVPHLEKMVDSLACTNQFTPVGNPAPELARAYEPVQLGNKPALLYIDASNTLKLFVP